MEPGKHTLWLVLAAAAILGYLVFFRQSSGGGGVVQTGPSAADLSLAQTVAQGNIQTALATIGARTAIIRGYLGGQQAIQLEQVRGKTATDIAGLEQVLGLQQTQAAVAIAKSQADAGIAIANAASNAQIQSQQIQANAVEQKNSQNFFGSILSTVLPFFHF